MAFISIVTKAQPQPNIYVESLKMFGHEVVCFSQPAQCVSHCLKRSPDLIILELCSLDPFNEFLPSELKRLRLDIPVLILSSKSPLQYAHYPNVAIVEPECISAFINVVEDLASHKSARI